MCSYIQRFLRQKNVTERLTFGAENMDNRDLVFSPILGVNIDFCGADSLFPDDFFEHFGPGLFLLVCKQIKSM